ncbi:hypothetical protein EON79_05640 [bacterium]|nr:MAG: hypothetical protein EON79_05640 [bacterium]
MHHTVPIQVLKDDLPYASCDVALKVYEHGVFKTEITFCTDVSGRAELTIDADEHADATIVVAGRELFGKRPLRDGITLRL